MSEVPQQTKKELPSLDYIAGLVSSRGNFGWAKKGKRIIPFFQIKIHRSELSTLKLVKAKLGLREKIYEYCHQNRNYALLLVRKKLVLEQTIIPSFEFRLFGAKQKQFEKWKKRFYRIWLAKLYPEAKI